jgi:hypothetical protein
MAKPIRQDLWDAVVRAYQEVGSIRAVAAILPVSKSGVAYILAERGAVLLPRNRRGKENSVSKTIAANPDDPRAKVRNPELMTALYLEQRKSTTEIGKLLGVDCKTVSVGLRQCGILARHGSEAIKGRPRPNYRGAKHRDWKGGVSGWRKRCRKLLNPLFVRPVMERDSFKCVWCGSRKKPTVHHHKRSFMQIVNKVRRRLRGQPEEAVINGIVLEHRLDDGITVCKKCHDAHHKEHGK